MPRSNKQALTAEEQALTAEERQERRAAQRERLEHATEELLSSDGWVRWLRARSVLRSAYSLRNTILIAQQAHERGFEPTYVAGFRAWLRLNRVVAKGQKGLRILAPVKVKERDDAGEETGEARIFFRETSVFDVSQTDELPGTEPVSLEPPRAETTGDSHAHLLEPLEALGGELGYTVVYEPIDPPGCAGRCHRGARKITVERDLPANRAVMVLIHELAHALIEPGTFGSTAREELAVESVAYLGCAAAGLDVEAEATNYLASWGGKDAVGQVRDLTEHIDALAARIERAITPTSEANEMDDVPVQAA